MWLYRVCCPGPGGEDAGSTATRCGDRLLVPAWACPTAARLGQGPLSAPAGDTKGINKNVKEELLKLSLDN